MGIGSAKILCAEVKSAHAFNNTTTQRFLKTHTITNDTVYLGCGQHQQLQTVFLL